MILGIETDVRIYTHFHRLLDTFAKLKADADAGPLDDDIDPAKAKYHRTVLRRAKTAFVSRIQVARVKCVAERTMLTHDARRVTRVSMGNVQLPGHIPSPLAANETCELPLASRVRISARID